MYFFQGDVFNDLGAHLLVFLVCHQHFHHRIQLIVIKIKFSFSKTCLYDRFADSFEKVVIISVLSCRKCLVYEDKIFN
jgi:hypothetical protein